ncbi:hypothetical protein Tco_1088345 [Tanacetum coccineum]
MSMQVLSSSIVGIHRKPFTPHYGSGQKDDPDVIYFDNSSDLELSTSLNDLDFTTLHIDGQSTDVDAPPHIIDVDEDDDIIDDEDALSHDLADSNDEDLINVDDDDDDVAMSADVAKGHSGDGGGDDRPPPHQIGGGCRGNGTRKPNLGGKKAGRLNTRKETKNLGLRKITDQFGPQAIRFEWNDRATLMPLGDHAAHWANLLGEIVRVFPMHFRSWHNILEEQKAGVMRKIGTQIDLTPHIQSDLWPKIKKGIQQHLAKIYTDNKSSLKAKHWVAMGFTTWKALRPANISGSRSRTVLQDRQSQHKVGSGSGSGGGGDDESGDEEDADEEEEEDEDS